MPETEPMRLTIENLAIPRKRPTRIQNALYTWHETANPVSRINPAMPIDSAQSGALYYPRLYSGSPPAGYSVPNTIAYAEIYTNTDSTEERRTHSVAKGRICYAVEATGAQVDGRDVLAMHAYVYDNDTATVIRDFSINPGYYLSSTRKIIEIKFKHWRYKDYTDVRQILGTNEAITLRGRQTRTDSFTNYECACPSGTFDLTVHVKTFNTYNGDYEEQDIDGIDSNSYIGTGGLTRYQLCVGADFKTAAQAAVDPSGHWLMDTVNLGGNITPTVSWS